MNDFYCVTPASAEGAAPRDWRCENTSSYSYCDGRAAIKAENVAGTNGGGIIWITAAFLDLSLANAAAVSARGINNSFNNTFAGTNLVPGGPSGAPASIQAGAAGGSIFIRADRLAPRTGAPGNGVISAAGGAGGGDGRVRLDIGAFTAAYLPAFSSPAAVTAGTGAPPP